jgi:hypothetical protein
MVQQSNPEDLKPQISHRLWVFESIVLGRYLGTVRAVCWGDTWVKEGGSKR